MNSVHSTVKDNLATVESTRKRFHSELQPEAMKDSSTEAAAVNDDLKVASTNGDKENEAALIEWSGEDVNQHDMKRTRRNSPVNGRTLILDEAEEDMPLLPIITDMKLPDPKEDGVEPDVYLARLVEALFCVQVKAQPGLKLGEGYFEPITAEQQAAYTMEVLTPARDNDVKALKEIVEKKGPQALNCVNRFGESLLNLACRRGFTEVAELLLSEEIGVDVRTVDDCGRTPFHDACWHATPLLDICGWLIQKDPSLLLVADKRGFTPFGYARTTDWSTWRQFLFDNRESLKLLIEPTTLERFSVKEAN
jgi:hypothetical protein